MTCPGGLFVVLYVGWRNDIQISLHFAFVEFDRVFDASTRSRLRSTTDVFVNARASTFLCAACSNGVLMS